jgi:filamentous hemagglutinin
VAQGPLTIAAGSLVNRGNVSSNADISLKTAGLDNDAGVIGANGKLAVEGSSVTNRGGSLQAKQGVDLQAGSGSVDNSGGLIRSDGTVNVQAASLRNDNTQGQNQGMEGATVRRRRPTSATVKVRCAATPSRSPPAPASTTAAV